MQKISWTRPPDLLIKINTDGCALDNPGKIGTGGILRDQKRNLILAYTSPLGNGTNNKVEIGATIFCMTWALDLGYMIIILEMDSILIVN